MINNIELTKITSTAPKTLTKKYWLDSAGVLQNKTAAHMSEGHADRVTLKTAKELADLLEGLRHNEALCFGLAPAENIRILSKDSFDKQGKPTDATTRSKEVFKWPEHGGIMMLDYDPREEQTPLSKTQLLNILTNVIPELANSAYVWWVSSSSLIANKETKEQLTPIKGQRVYILVKDAADIERAGAVLFKRLWLAGYGYYAISKAGVLLERSIVDASVWQTNRLDFAAGANCAAPLEQQRDKPSIQDGELLDTSAALPELTESEREDFETKKAQAKKEAEPNRDAIRQEYVHETAITMLTERGLECNENNLEAANQVIRRALNGVLAGDFYITLANKEKLTVGALLDDPSKYHGQLTLDPLEPEYDNYKVTGKLYLIGGRANLYSQAHGGRNFRLIRQPQRIEHINGTTADTTHRTLDFLRQMPDVFDHGEEMALVRDGRLIMLNRDSLSFYLGSVAQYFFSKKTNSAYEEVNIDPREPMIKQIFAAGLGRGLKPLTAVITAPIIDTTGRIISKAGYDKKTQLYLDLIEDAQPIVEQPTKQDVRDALVFLTKPFKDFATATDLDKGVLLAAILTAIVRPILPIAPAIGLDAPVMGTGKTYLAQCLGMLSTGEQPAIMPHTAGRDDEETRKRLFTVLLAGDRVMIWDNILGHFDSAALASFITSEVYEDRKLGFSEKSKIPNRLLVLLTGNNLALAGDMPSRVLKLRLDTQLENPTTRQFNGNPLEYIKQHRQALVMAGLTVIKGYLASTEYKDKKIPRSTRFDVWDLLVRQPIAWLSNYLDYSEYLDPAKALEEATNNDPEKETLGLALTLIQETMGAKWWTTRELMSRITTTDGELEEVLQDLARKSETLTSRGLGRLLSYRKDRLVNGMRLIQRDGSTVANFKVETIKALANEKELDPIEF